MISLDGKVRAPALERLSAAARVSSSTEELDAMADEDMEALERMMAAMEAKEREAVDEHVTRRFPKMRIAWEANAIEGGGDGVVFKCNAPMVKDGGHMKEFAGHAFHEAIRVKLGLSAECEKKLAKKASLAALDEAALFYMRQRGLPATRARARPS